MARSGEDRGGVACTHLLRTGDTVSYNLELTEGCILCARLAWFGGRLGANGSKERQGGGGGAKVEPMRAVHGEKRKRRGKPWTGAARGDGRRKKERLGCGEAGPGRRGLKAWARGRHGDGDAGTVGGGEEGN